MKYGRIKVYHNLKFGYIFCAETTVAGTVMKTVMDPVSIGRQDLSDAQIGEKILENLEKSRNAPPIERAQIQNFKFWQISGIKGFAAFSKQFNGVSLFEEDSKINIMQLVRDADGAYVVPETQLPVQLDAKMADLTAQIGQQVRKLLAKVPGKESDQEMSFETVDGRRVFYKRPSDEFANVGDGHTDAYQVFVQEENPNNAIMFLMVCDDTRLDEAAVRERWEQFYGKLRDFTYCILDGKDKEKIIQVSAKTNSQEVLASIWCEKNEGLEIVAQIDGVRTSAKGQEEIRKEYHRLLASIQFM